MTTYAMRYERMYDEHMPPQEGIEKTIMEILEEKPRNAIQLFGTLRSRGFIRRGFIKRVGDDQLYREHLWYLIDRGYVGITSDWKLQAHTTPLSPAPCDMV